jgi:hypothetical protein
MIKFEREKLPVEIYGEKFELHYPTVGELEAYVNKLSEPGEVSEFDIVSDFLEGLGLPRKTSKAMEVDHLKQLGEALRSEKKS